MAEHKFLFLVVFVTTLCNSHAGDVIIDTKSGKVSGKVVNSIIPDKIYYSFLSIPYAEPPVGKLRFMAPQPHPGWDDVLNCKKERSSCAQMYLPVRQTRWYGFYGEEDCLHLSIHSPKIPTDDNPNLPVIIFLQNEQFRISYNVTKDYGPDFFMEEGVIIVTVKHRLGSLGFLSYEDDLLPGNNGLRDVILALKWLKENIQNFGGDPNKFTLMGHQSGAVLVDILLHSPKAKGLFNAAILQSGTSWNSMYLNKNGRKRAIELAETLEISAVSSSNLLSNLARIQAVNLTEAELRSVHADEARKIQKGTPPFAPVIEHDHPEAIITKLPEESDIDINIPVMLGYNSRESLELCERFLRKPQYLTFADRDFLLVLPIRMNYHFQLNDNMYNKAIQEIKDFYFEEGYVKISKAGEYLSFISDIMLFYPIDYTVRKYANESKAPVYYYTFDYSGEFNLRKKQILEEAHTFDGTWGATTGDELCYLFICKPLRQKYLKALLDNGSEEIKVLKNMVKLWTNFAKSGNPTPQEEEVIWKPATKESKDCLVINEDLEMRTNLHSDKIEFWDDFLERYKSYAVDGVVKDIKDEL